MNEADFKRMSEIFFSILENDTSDLTESDRDYFTNRLEPFSEEMVQQAVIFLGKQFSVPQDLATAIVMSISMVSRMSGAHGYHDFVITEHLAHQG